MMNENLNQLMSSSQGAKDYLSNLEERLLLLFFRQNTWNRLSSQGRLRVLQEVENRRAKADGRPAAKLMVHPGMGPNTFGGHLPQPNGQAIIFINIRFLQADKFGTFSGAKAFGTVLHEGRHAFQRHAIEDKLEKVPFQQRLEWAAVMGCFGGLYTTDQTFYFLQSIEMDARRFARRNLAKLNNYFTSIGIEDSSIKLQMQKDLELEWYVISQVRRNLTLKKIDEYEKKVLDHFKQSQPHLDLKNLRLFNHARFILQHPEINDPKEMLDRLDKMADDKLGFNDAEKINRLKGFRLNRFQDFKG